MKICLQCSTEMKMMNKERVVYNWYTTRHGDGFLIPPENSDLKSNLFVCPKCGLVQEYVKDEYMKYIQEM